MNNNTDHLIQIIKIALTSHDNNQRSEAEAKILSYRDSNTTGFFLTCAQIIDNDKYDVQSRQSAGTVATRLINMKNLNTNQTYWEQIRPTEQEQIKNHALSVLISPFTEVMKAGASLIAVIASIELPQKKWYNIIDLLAEHSTNNDMTIKIASITTLGYICEQIKKAQGKIENRISEQIIGAIIYAIRQNNEGTRRTCLKALEDSLSFLQEFMQVQNYRDAVFSVFVDNFKNNIQIDRTYQALYEFVKVTGPYLGQYKKTFIDLSEIHLENRSEIAGYNLQLWSHIGLDYAEKYGNTQDRIGENISIGDNFLQSVADDMLPLIMKCLLITTKQEQEDNDEQLRASTCRALQTFVKVCDKRVIDKITQSVGTLLGLEDPYHQQASVILFSTICEYPDRETALEMFENGFDHFLNLLNSTSRIVVKNSLIGFIRLSQAFPEVFLKSKNFNDLVEQFFNYLSCDVKDVRSIVAQILSNITEGLKENPQPVCDDPSILLTRTVKFYSDNRIKLHNQQVQINEKLISIIMNIVMNSNKRDVIVQLIEYMMIEYYSVINSNVENQYMLVEQTLSVLHTSILAHKNAVPNNEILSKLCELINAHIKKYGIQHEGLTLIGALCTTFNKAFIPRSKAYWGHILHGLNCTNEMATFKSALSAIGDFARMKESDFVNEATMVMKQLLIFVKDNLDRQVKLAIITCVGDLILSMQKFGEMFLDDILNIADICFQAVYEFGSFEKDEDYIEELKTSTIEMYSCVIFALNGSHSKEVNKRLFDHFGNLATFVVRTCQKAIHPTVDYLKTCLYLLHDSAAFYENVKQCKDQVKHIMGSGEVMELVHSIYNFKNRKDVKELLDFIDDRQRMMPRN